MHTKNIIVFSIFCIFLFTLSQTIFISTTGKATLGSVEICFNTPPTIIFDCETNLTQSTILQTQNYTCQLNATDPNTIDTIKYFYSSENLEINLNQNTGFFWFQPTDKDTGDHLVTFIVKDNSDCFIGNDSIEVTYTITDINDPPIYFRDIPPAKFYELSSSRGIYLTNHFKDPDDILTNFTAYPSSPNLIISLTSSYEVIYSSSICGDYTALFKATDDGDPGTGNNKLSAYSDVIDVTVECIPEENENQPSGGMGGFSDDCVPEWVCKEWSRCYSNSTRKKVCTDIYACNKDYTQTFWENCTYIPHCENGILDYDEENIDCGGKDCDPCQTCSDNILNNLEEEIDCGGPNCEPCKNCYDGIQNYGETGIDCGGYCDPCPSCYDGIQNYGETGIDCGGPCDPCSELSVPDPLKMKDPRLWNFIILAILLLSVLILTYKLGRTRIAEIFTKIWLFLTRKKRKQILLNSHQKSILLTKISQLDSKQLLIKNKVSEFKKEILDINSQLFEDLLNPYTDLEHLKKQIEELPTTNLVKELVTRQYSHLVALHNKELTILELTLISEFTRLSVIDFSESNLDEIKRKISEIEVDLDDISSKTVMNLVYNGILASQFNHLDSAKEKYFEALDIYNRLSYLQQQNCYPYIGHLFDNIKYFSIISKK